MTNTDWFKLSKNKAKFIFIYYGFIFLIGLYFTGLSILHFRFLANYKVTEVALIGSMGIALVGSIMFYSKKLYKAFINLELSEPLDDDDKLREFGITLYYILRPIFSLAFAMLLVITLKTACKIITVEEELLDVGFIYLTMFFSFFCGFASGDVLDILQDISSEIVNKVFKGQP